MADVNSNIIVNLDSSAALAQLRRLQAGLSKFHQTLAEGNLAAANAQKGLNAQLIQSVNAGGKLAASQVKIATSTQAFTTALERNKLSLKEYFRYSAAAATANTRTLGRMFAQEREIINRARKDRVKALQSQYIQLNKANSGFVEALRVMPRSLMMANGKFTELGTRIQYAAQRQQFLNQLLKQGSTQLLNFGKNTQWAGRQLMVGLTMPLMLLGGYAAKSFKEVEAVLVKFKRVYGDAFTDEAQLNAAVDNIKQIANEYTKFGVAVKDTIDMAATAAAAGFTGAALEQQVRSASKLAVLGQIEQQQALETTISLQNAFGLSADQLAEKINFLNAVENQTVLSIEDLTIAIPKAAPVVKQLGGNVEDLAFFLTAMKEGGINASEGANALKSGLASLINPTDKASKMLASMGINIKGLIEANKGDLKGTVVGFARALDTLDPLNRARAIEQLFGKFQFARLSTLFQNVSKDGTQAARAFDLAGASVEELAIISEREMNKVQDAVGVKFQAAVEQFKKDIMPLGKAFLEALTPVVKFFGKLFEKFNNLSDGTKKVVAIITGVVAGLGPILLMTFGLLMNGLANLIKLFAFIRGGMAKLNGQTKVLGAGFDYVTQSEIENIAQSNALHTSHQRLIEVFNVEKVALQQLAASYAAAASQARALATSSPSLFASPGAGAAVSKLPPIRTVKRYADGVLTVPGPKGAGDIQPALLAPGEAVIPADITEKNKGFISAMMADKIPGHVKGRVPKAPPYHAKPGEQQSGAQFLGMPKSHVEATQSRQIADKISQDIAKSQYGKIKPTNFGTLLEPFKGYSFPVKGVGGVYRKPNGELVVVKPTMNESTAMADIRANDLTRLHDLNTPKSKIAKIIDPTDPEGKRQFLVLVSRYDKKYSKEGMTGKFTKKQTIKQLVASTIRGDRDLQQSNVSGSNAPDASNAYIFNKGSGYRDIAQMPSMVEMGMINTLGVKGGAKKFFAGSTSSLISKMTPQEYNAAIKEEIKRVLPRYKNEIENGKNFQNLNPLEQKAYLDVVARLEQGLKDDWTKVYYSHVAAGNKVNKYDGGPGTFEPSESQAMRALRQKKEFLAWADEQIKNSNLDQKLKDRWEKSTKESFIKNFNNKVTFDPQTETFLTNRGGTSGANLARLKERFRYRFGIAPDAKTGQYVNSNLFNINKFLENITVGGASKKGSDISTRNKEARTVWNEIKKLAVNPDNISSPKVRQKYMRFLADMTDEKGNYTELAKNLRSSDPARRLSGIRTVNQYLRTEAAHAQAVRVFDSLEDVAKGKSRPASKTEKYKLGVTGPDFGAVNNYVKVDNPANRSRFEKILSWNDSKGNPLGIDAAKKAQINDAIKAIAKEENHPFTPENQKRVKTLTELELLARQYKAENPKAALSFLRPEGYATVKLVDKIMQDRIGDSSWYSRLQKKNMFLHLDDLDKDGKPKRGKGVITARKTEYVWNNAKQKFEPLTGQNTIPVPPGRVTNNGTETRTPDVNKTGGGPVATRQQVRAIRRDGGDPTLRVNKYDKMWGELSNKAQKRILNQLRQNEKLLIQRNTLTEKEITRTLLNLRRNQIIAEHNAKIQREKLEYARREAKIEEEKIRRANEKAAEEKRLKRVALQEKVGRYSGGVSAATGAAAMGAMMSGADSKVTTGLFALSGIAGMAPMLTNPYVAAGTAVVALTASLWLADKAAKKQAESVSKFVDATTATTEKMKSIGEITNKVGASEIYARKRKMGTADRYTTGFERGRQRFGETFLESNVGKDVMQGFKESLVQNGAKISAKQMSVQLAGYISDGILSAEQAHSIAQQIGFELNDTALGANISGQLLDLVGPGGEDLLKDPLNVRVNLVKEQQNIAAEIPSNLKQELGEYNVMERSTDAGAILTWFKETFTQTKPEKIASQAAALGAQTLEFNQAQIDSLNAQYDKEIKKLQVQKAATADKQKQKQLDEQIAQLEADKVTGSQKLREANSDILDQQLEIFHVAQERSAVEDAFFESLKNQVKTKWKDDPFTDTFLEQSADLESKDLEVKIDTIVASGQLSPMAASNLISVFGKDGEGELNATLDIAAKFTDPGKFMNILNMFGKFTGDKGKAAAKKQIKFLTDLAAKDPAKADKLLSTITLMQKMDGKEVNLQAFFEADDAQQKLEELSNLLEQVEQMPTPITKQALIDKKEIGDVPLDGILARWKEFENLPDSVKKTVIQEYITLYKTIDENAVNAEIAKRVAAGGGGDTLYQYYSQPAQRDKIRQELAAKDTMQKVKQDIANANANAAGTGDGNKKEDPLIALLTRLKNVRNAAIDTMGGMKALNAALADKGPLSAIDRFEGLDQQLNKLGKNRQFIDYLMNLDKEGQAKLLKTDKKGNPLLDKQGQIQLSDYGQKVNQVFDLAVVGDFNTAIAKTLTSFKEQETTRKKLVALGYDNATVERILQDEYMTSAIALGTITDESLRINAALSKEYSWRQKINDILQNTQDKINAINNLKSISKLSEFIKTNSLNISKETFNQIIGDPDALDAMVTAMNNYGDSIDDVKAKMLELANALKTVQANSHLQLAADFAKMNASQRMQAGYNAQQKIGEVKRTIYNRLTIGELGKVTAENQKTKAITNVGQKAIDKVNARYVAAGVAIPSLTQSTNKNVAPLGLQNLKGIQTQRADLAKTIQVGQSQLNNLQSQYQQKQDALANAQKNLDESLKKLNDNYDKLVQTQEDKVKTLEKKIQTDYESKITNLNKESKTLSNDLAIMDHAAEEINKKYDEQQSALEKIKSLNDQIAESQRQQLDLADALTQGDIAAAARAAQDMRASNASSQADIMSQAIEQSRTNEINALRGKETGKSRDQIEERQYQISQEIYALETDPIRLQIEKDIIAAKEEITRLEEERTIKVKQLNDNFIEETKQLESQLQAIETQMSDQQSILDTLNNQDAALASQEEYLQAIVDAAVELDDTSGKTLESWQDLVDATFDIQEYIDAYLNAVLASEDSVANQETSWSNILNSILAIPKEITTKITEVREVVYSYSNAGDPNKGDPNKGDPNKGDPKKSPGAAWISDGKGGWIQPPKPKNGEYYWDDNKGWLTDEEDAKIAAEKARQAAAKAAAEAAAKAAAEKAAAELAAAKARAEQNANRWANLYGYENSGGLVPNKYFASGGLSIGSDIVPAMLTPGEFVMSKYAVNSYGLDKMKAINNGSSIGESVYNYSINVSVKSDANPDEIARAVMTQIQRVNAQSVRSVKIS